MKDAVYSFKGGFPYSEGGPYNAEEMKQLYAAGWLQLDTEITCTSEHGEQMHTLEQLIVRDTAKNLFIRATADESEENIRRHMNLTPEKREYERIAEAERDAAKQSYLKMLEKAKSTIKDPAFEQKLHDIQMRHEAEEIKMELNRREWERRERKIIEDEDRKRREKEERVRMEEERVRMEEERVKAEEEAKKREEEKERLLNEQLAEKQAKIDKKKEDSERGEPVAQRQPEPQPRPDAAAYARSQLPPQFARPVVPPSPSRRPPPSLVHTAELGIALVDLHNAPAVEYVSAVYPPEGVPLTEESYPPLPDTSTRGRGRGRGRGSDRGSEKGRGSH